MEKQASSKAVQQGIQVSSIDFSVGMEVRPRGSNIIAHADPYLRVTIKLMGQGNFDYLGLVVDEISSTSLRDYERLYLDKIPKTIASSPEELLRFIDKNRNVVSEPQLVSGQLTTRFRLQELDAPAGVPSENHVEHAETLRWTEGVFRARVQGNYREVECALHDYRHNERLVIISNLEKGNGLVRAIETDMPKSVRIVDRMVVTEVVFKIFGVAPSGVVVDEPDQAIRTDYMSPSLCNGTVSENIVDSIRENTDAIRAIRESQESSRRLAVTLTLEVPEGENAEEFQARLLKDFTARRDADLTTPK